MQHPTAARLISPISRAPSGRVHWDARPGDIYIVTGTDTRGRRFRYQFAHARTALSINLWRGSVWLLRNNHRHLIRRTWN